MGFPVRPSLDRPFAHRTAFLLNANARSVRGSLIEELAEIVPAGDLFLSRTMDDAQVFLRTIARRGYGQVFFGGGDGTLVAGVSTLREVTTQEGLAMPNIGVLKLGTGNAMATAVHAQSPVVDAYHVVHHGEVRPKRVQMVEVEGSLTPFAGMGYDGAVLNDYVWLKQKAKISPLGRHVVETVWGYLGAVMLRTVPHEVTRAMPQIRVTTRADAYRVVHAAQGDEEHLLPAGSVIFEGRAPIVSVGSIPYFGYGFTMFPFAERKEGYVHLRLGDLPIPTILANLWPGLWNGTFRHPQIQDFLIRDVLIESDRELPFQLGGDARGARRSLSVKTAAEAVPMVELGERLMPRGHAVVQLGPARLTVRLPR